MSCGMIKPGTPTAEGTPESDTALSISRTSEARENLSPKVIDSPPWRVLEFGEFHGWT